FFFQAEDGIRDGHVTGVQTCALPIWCGSSEFGRLCLLARRLVERGVRVVQLRSGGWDAHGDLKKNHTPQAKKTDKPIAALLTDRSEERRVGKECRAQWTRAGGKKRRM